MAPSKKKTTNADGNPNLTKHTTLADSVLPVKINAVPDEEEVFASHQLSSDYSWMRIRDWIWGYLNKIMKRQDSRGVPDLDVLNNSKKSEMSRF
jgi:hypothetical protein